MLADEALTALEAKERELAHATAALEEKSADAERLSSELKNQTDSVSRLMAEVHPSHELPPRQPMPSLYAFILSSPDDHASSKIRVIRNGGSRQHRQMG